MLDDIPNALTVDPDELQEVEWYDEKEAQDLPLDMERPFRKLFVEPIYRQHADAEKLYQSCQAQCRRSRRCCYVRMPKEPNDKEQPIRYNMSVRFMPLCIARDPGPTFFKDLRWWASYYLR